MKLTFLGTGTSTGVPQMRCKCPVCSSDDPHDRRLRASAMVQTEQGAPLVLIDCGPDFREQMLRTGCPDLACALLTHSHYDHVGGVDDLRPYAYSAPGHHFPLYCREDVAGDLRARVPYCFAEHPYPGVPQFDLRCVAPGEPFLVDLGPGFKPLEVTALPLIHGRLPIYGYKLGDSLAYITDASVVPDETIDAIRGIDTLVINALRHDPHMSHMNLQQALDVIKLTAPRQTFLTHVSHQLGLYAETEPTLPQGVSLAYDGLTIKIASENGNQSNISR